jgi:spore germination protein GerM
MTDLETRLEQALRNPQRDLEAPNADEVMRLVRTRVHGDAADRPDRPWGKRGVVPMLAVAASVLLVVAGAVWVTSSDRDPVSGDSNSVAADRETVRAGNRQVQVYFLVWGDRGYRHIAAQTVTTDNTGDAGLDAVRALLTSRPSNPEFANGFDFLTIKPRPITDVNDVSSRDGVITVDLSEEVWDPYPNVACSASCPHGDIVAQQLVWTVQTAMDTTAPVLITVNGQPARGIWFEPLDGPITADSDAPVIVRDDGPTLNVGEWTPGSDSMQALGGGQVAVDHAGCVHLVSGNHITDVVWPAGYTAEYEDGRVVIRNPDGQVVLLEGDEFRAGGGSLTPRHPEDLACRASGDRDVFYINEELPPR